MALQERLYVERLRRREVPCRMGLECPSFNRADEFVFPRSLASCKYAHDVPRETTPRVRVVRHHRTPAPVDVRVEVRGIRAEEELANALVGAAPVASTPSPTPPATVEQEPCPCDRWGCTDCYPPYPLPYPANKKYHIREH